MMNWMGVTPRRLVEGHAEILMPKEQNLVYPRIFDSNRMTGQKNSGCDASAGYGNVLVVLLKNRWTSRSQVDGAKGFVSPRESVNGCMANMSGRISGKTFFVSPIAGTC